MDVEPNEQVGSENEELRPVGNPVEKQPESVEIGAVGNYQNEETAPYLPSADTKSTQAKKTKILVVLVIVLMIATLGVAVFAVVSKLRPGEKGTNPSRSTLLKPDSVEAGEPACPFSYEIDGSVCVRTLKAPPFVTFSCAPGLIEVGNADICGAYVGEAKPYYRCPVGTIFEFKRSGTHYCFTKSRTNSEGCSDDPQSGYFYSEAHKKCYYGRVDLQSIGTCGDVRLVVHDNRCYQPAPKEKIYSCSGGYSLDSDEGMCVKVERTELKKTCPADYAYDAESDKCLRHKYEKE